MASWWQWARGPVLTAPGPSGGDMLRSFTAIRSNPLGFLERAWRAHGPVVQFPVPVPPTYLVSSVEGARHVLVGNARAYGKRTLQYSALSLVTGEGLLTADTEQWRTSRRILQPAFHHAAVALVADHVDAAVGRLVRQWRACDGEVVDVDDAMMRAALEVVGGALFGTDLSGRAGLIARATLEALEVVVARARMPLHPPSWVPSPDNLRLRRALRRLDGAVALILRERSGPLPESPRDMLDLLLAAHGEDPSTMDARRVRDEIVTFIVAGHETVASALTWSWHLLAHDPAAYERLLAEARSLEGPLTAETVQSTPFARAVFDEALRLYPPAWLITRDAREADVIDGIRIPEGALVIISPWIVHRDPTRWERPEAFDPDRWSGAGLDRHAYLPFGAGPRLCIGRDMALLEGVLMLTGIARHLRFEDVGQQVHAEPLVTIRPRDGLHLRVRVNA